MAHGKTTLLKAIVNNEMLEEGIGNSKFEIYKQGKMLIGHLKQIEFENNNNTFLEEILKAYEELVNLENKINELQKNLEKESNEKLIKEYTESLEKYEIGGGYTYKKEYQTAVQKFGFRKEDLEKKISEFSGGQKTK